MVRTVVVTGDALAVEDVVDVGRGRARARLGPDVAACMAPSRRVVEEAVAAGRVMYGVTTGFGALADTRIGSGDLALMQRALLRSHAAAVGDPLPDEVVRALLLLRARMLVAGRSGVRVDLPARLLEVLDRGLLPDGTHGPATADGRDGADIPAASEGRPAAEGLAAEGLEPSALAPKEGLSLVNGTEPMQAVLTRAVADAAELVRLADVACAMSLDALLGTDRAYDPRVLDVRPHPEQLASTANLRALLCGSGLLASHRDDPLHAVQDAYCLGCAPQVHGAVRDVLGSARRTLDVELGSVVDNPVIVAAADPADGFEAMSTGNFHGEPFAADMLAMALAELASISERRTDRLLDPALSRGLPAFLALAPGTDSDYMLAQFTAASLVGENKALAHAASVDTLPTSGNQEDHVSMGWHAVRTLAEVVDNARNVLAAELVRAAQGLDLRAAGAAPTPAVAAVLAPPRADVPRMDVDRGVGPQLAATTAALPDLLAAAEAVTGPQV